MYGVLCWDWPLSLSEMCARVLVNANDGGDSGGDVEQCRKHRGSERERGCHANTYSFSHVIVVRFMVVVKRFFPPSPVEVFVKMKRVINSEEWETN